MGWECRDESVSIICICNRPNEQETRYSQYLILPSGRPMSFPHSKCPWQLYFLIWAPCLGFTTVSLSPQDSDVCGDQASVFNETICKMVILRRVAFLTHCGLVTPSDCSVAFTREQFTANVQATTMYNVFENYAFDITVASPKGQLVQLAIIMTNIQYNPKYVHGLLSRVLLRFASSGFYPYLSGLLQWHGKWLPYYRRSNPD